MVARDAVVGMGALDVDVGVYVVTRWGGTFWYVEVRDEDRVVLAYSDSVLVAGWWCEVARRECAEVGLAVYDGRVV